MDYWYQREPGLLILEQERRLLSGLLQDKRGDFLLQFGGPSDLSLSSASPISSKVYIALQANRRHFTAETIVAEQLQLPILPGSIDVVVLAHVLGLVDEPQLFLQEVVQTLAPDGQLFLFGFNRWGLWRLSRLAEKESSFPWVTRFYSLRQVLSWLRNFNLDIVVKQTLGYRPLSMNSEKWHQCYFMETLGQTCLPSIGGIYFIVAQKREESLTPLRVTRERRIANGLAQAYQSSIAPNDVHRLDKGSD